MAQVGQAQSSPAAPAGRQRRSFWAGPLVAGLSFGLAFGLTQRLVSLNVGELIRFGHGFDVQVFPGTSLESLRLRFGAAESELRGDLELQELQRRQEAAPAMPAAQPDATAPAESVPQTARDGAAEPPPDDALLDPIPEAPPPPTDPAAEVPASDGR